MLGIANMTEISRHYTHSIYTDSHRFFTVFAPDDLVRRCGGQFQVIRGLEHVLEHRMAACLNNLRTLAELRRTSSAGNTLPDYVEIHEEDVTQQNAIWLYYRQPSSQSLAATQNKHFRCLFL